ncbi:hypothetical protein V8E54_011800 [Elaphomyces granulatus]
MLEEDGVDDDTSDSDIVSVLKKRSAKLSSLILCRGKSGICQIAPAARQPGKVRQVGLGGLRQSRVRTTCYGTDRSRPDCDKRGSGDSENEVVKLVTQHLSAVTLQVLSFLTRS